MFGYIYKTTNLINGKIMAFECPQGFVAGRLNFNSHVRRMQAPREG